MNPTVKVVLAMAVLVGIVAVASILGQGTLAVGAVIGAVVGFGATQRGWFDRSRRSGG
jgi:hypothetical protein